jgi:CheY-like chemotaxis protein
MLKAGAARPARVLVADDDPDMRRLVALILRRAGFEVVLVRDVMEAVDRLALNGVRTHRDVQAIVSDLRMPGLSGLDLLALLRCASVRVPVILVSAFHDDASRAEARALGAAAVLDKPVDRDVLASLVARATSGRGLRADA